MVYVVLEGRFKISALTFIPHYYDYVDCKITLCDGKDLTRGNQSDVTIREKVIRISRCRVFDILDNLSNICSIYSGKDSLSSCFKKIVI